MRNLQTALSATITAVIIGLLVANISSAARAAEIQHAKQVQIATLNASVGVDDTQLQLEAYKQRYTEAYNQMVAAYTQLQQRDAGYGALLHQSQGTSAQLEAANASLEARLSQAYQAMQQAQAQLAAMGVTQPVAAANPPARNVAAAPAGPAGAAPVAAAPNTNTPPTVPATPRPIAPPTAQYCHNDAEGQWHCEDHPW